MDAEEIEERYAALPVRQQMYYRGLSWISPAEQTRLITMDAPLHVVLDTPVEAFNADNRRFVPL
jgi:hypothetical protein